MPKQISRTLVLYSIHGHIAPGAEDEELLDYSAFFQSLRETDPRTLQFVVSGETVAVTQQASNDDRLAFYFVSGNANEVTLVYDTQTAETRAVEPGKNQLFVSGAWVIVDPVRRLVVVEQKRPGVQIYRVERFLAQFGREMLGFPALSISLNPVPSPSFEAEVKRFSRIREASIALRRPNHSWSRTAASMLGQLAESNARRVEIQLNAERGGSLSKDEGIVPDILDMTQRTVTPLENVTLRGDVPGFEKERSISLKNHVEKATAPIQPTDTPLEQLKSLDENGARLMDVDERREVPRSENESPAEFPRTETQD